MYGLRWGFLKKSILCGNEMATSGLGVMGTWSFFLYWVDVILPSNGGFSHCIAGTGAPFCDHNYLLTAQALSVGL